MCVSAGASHSPLTVSESVPVCLWVTYDVCISVGVSHSHLTVSLSVCVCTEDNNTRVLFERVLSSGMLDEVSSV